MRGQKTHIYRYKIPSKLNILLKPAFEPQNWFKTSKNHIIKFGLDKKTYINCEWKAIKFWIAFEPSLAQQLSADIWESLI